MLVEQEQAIMAGVALGVTASQTRITSINQSNAGEPLLDEPNGRVRNVLVVDSNGTVLDSLSKEYAPVRSRRKRPLCEDHGRAFASSEKRGRSTG